jgi:flagellar motility protein MotE (MotC chaperone)
MEANCVFENIISFIKTSNLNYHLEQTHFSAQRDKNTSLKKSLKSKNEEMKDLKNELKNSNKALSKKEEVFLNLKLQLKVLKEPTKHSGRIFMF